MNLDIQWHSSIKDIPEGPFILIANEVIDVFPIRQFEKSDLGWLERKVDCDNIGNLAWVLDKSPVDEKNLIPSKLIGSKKGSIFELGQKGMLLVKNITQALVQFGGAALIIDYGYCRTGVGDTLQGIRKHDYYDVLCDPGEVDLTAHVDFESLAQHVRAAGGAAYGAVSQRNFLVRLGILNRANLLKTSASICQRSDILAGLNRLIGVDEMGDLFKVLAITPPDQPVPEGFRGIEN